METKFQTSFIPKKPLMPTENTHTPSSTSILMLIAVLVFIASIAGAGFAVFAKSYLLKAQLQHKVDLAENEKRFNLPLIEELKRANNKIDIAKQLLKNHLAVSEALNIVGGLTAEKVHFSDFEFSPAEPAGRAAPGGAVASGNTVYKIKMKGTADSFNSIAFQSDVFGRSQKYGTNKVIRNPILSDLTVDPDGAVKFNFSMELVLPDISYEKMLASTLQSEGLVSPGQANN